MPKFKTKPVVVDAFQFTGNDSKALRDFLGPQHTATFYGDHLKLMGADGLTAVHAKDWIVRHPNTLIEVKTPEEMEALYDRVK